MVITQQGSQPNYTSTKDWIDRLEGGLIYSYDPGSGAVQCVPEQPSPKRSLPIGEHIREAIDILKGHRD